MIAGHAKGWTRHRLKFVADINAATLPENTDPDWQFDYVDISRVTQGIITDDPQPTTFAHAPSRARRLAAPGDTIVSTVRTYLRAVAQVVDGEDDQVFSTGFAVIHPRSGSVDPRFLSYYLQSTPFVERVVADSVGVSYPAINPSQIGAYDLRLPGVPVQRAIADFLDRETAQIDAMIEAQQDVLDQIAARQSAVVTRAVTNGVDGAALAPSGNEYLGAIPLHWKPSRFGRHVRINEGQVDPRDDPWASMTLIAPNHVESGTGRLLGLETAEDQGADSGKYRVQEGQIVYSKIRPHLNKVAIAPMDSLCSADMYAISCLGESDHRFYRYFMLAAPFHRYATSISDRVKMPKVNRDELAGAPWVVVPLEEQRRIADFLDETTARGDSIYSEASRVVMLLRERREALITAAVTGRIDPSTGIERLEDAS